MLEAALSFRHAMLEDGARRKTNRLGAFRERFQSGLPMNFMLSSEVHAGRMGKAHQVLLLATRALAPPPRGGGGGSNSSDSSGSFELVLCSVCCGQCNDSILVVTCQWLVARHRASDFHSRLGFKFGCDGPADQGAQSGRV